MQPQIEQSLRTRTAALVVDWAQAQSPPFSGQDKAAFGDVIAAAHIVSDEARLGLHRWIDAGRRAGMSWTELGATLGISKQAAQQRFRSVGELDPETETADEPIKIRVGPTAFNEMQVLQAEGRAGNELIRTGAFLLVFRRTDRPWEHARVIAGTAQLAIERMAPKGWRHVSSWFPFHYFKRPVDDAG